jgi:hypothetical protein
MVMLLPFSVKWRNGTSPASVIFSPNDSKKTFKIK